MFDAFMSLDDRERQLALMGLAGRLATPNRGGLMGALGEGALGLAGDIDYYRRRGEERGIQKQRDEFMREQIDNMRTERMQRMEEAQRQSDEQIKLANLAAKISGAPVGAPPGGTRPGGVSPQTALSRPPITDPTQIRGLMVGSGVPEMMQQGLAQGAQAAQQQAQVAAERGMMSDRFKHDMEMWKAQREKWTPGSMPLGGGASLPMWTSSTGEPRFAPAAVNEAASTAGLAASVAPDAEQKPEENKPGMLNWLSDRAKGNLGLLSSVPQAARVAVVKGLTGSGAEPASQAKTASADAGLAGVLSAAESAVSSGDKKLIMSALRRLRSYKPKDQKEAAQLAQWESSLQSLVR
jgi:hypothetical protein